MVPGRRVDELWAGKKNKPINVYGFIWVYFIYLWFMDIFSGSVLDLWLRLLKYAVYELFKRKATNLEHYRFWY